MKVRILAAAAGKTKTLAISRLLVLLFIFFFNSLFAFAMTGENALAAPKRLQHISREAHECCGSKIQKNHNAHKKVKNNALKYNTTGYYQNGTYEWGDHGTIWTWIIIVSICCCMYCACTGWNRNC